MGKTPDGPSEYHTHQRLMGLVETVKRMTYIENRLMELDEMAADHWNDLQMRIRKSHKAYKSRVRKYVCPNCFNQVHFTPAQNG